MHKTELERHLLDGLEKMRQELLARQNEQDMALQRITATIQEHQSHIEQLSDYYGNLEPLLERLNAILQSVIPPGK